MSSFNSLPCNINTRKEETEALIDLSKQAGLEVNAEKTKFMLLSRHQNLGQDLNIKLGNKSFENEVKLKYEYLGTTLNNQNRIREKNIEFWEYLLPFSSELLAVPSAVCKPTDCNERKVISFSSSLIIYV
jgi:hypothetical protein